MADPPRGSFQLSGKSPIRCRGTRGCTLALVCTRPCPVYLAEGHDAIAIRKGKSGGFKECLRASLPASCLILSSPYSFGVSFYPARSLFFFSPPLSFMLRVLFKQSGDTVGVSVFFYSRYSGKNNISAISGTRADVLKAFTAWLFTANSAGESSETQQ
jgi:hypothetical protein